MKVTELFEASKGEQAIAFADYLESGYVSAKHRNTLQDVAARLFQRGWKFFPHPNPRINEPTPAGFGMALPFGKKVAKLGTNKVDILYTAENVLNYARSVYRIDQLKGDGLDDALQEVKDEALT